jgi:hypothetical protein
MAFKKYLYGTTVCPLGLLAAQAILATVLLCETPHEAV